MQAILSALSIELNIKKVYHEMGYSVDAGVEILAKQAHGKTYLLTVNSDRKPVRVSLLGLDAYQKATVLKENRFISITNGELVDDFEPFGVHVYELE